MARDETKQQAEPIPAPEFPYARPVSLPDQPHGSYQGLGITPPAPILPGDRSGDQRRTPTPARVGVAAPGSSAMIGR